MESPDGKWFYFRRGPNHSVWRMPVEGGGEETEEDAEQVLESSHGESYEVVEDGVYFVPLRGGPTFPFTSSALPRAPSSRSMISRDSPSAP